MARWGVAALAVLVVVAGLVGIVMSQASGMPDGGQWRGDAQITEWYLVDGMLVVNVDTCNGEPEITELTETADSVTLRIESTHRNPGDACLDGIEVPLAAPLGDRALVDALTGAAVPGNRG